MDQWLEALEKELLRPPAEKHLIIRDDGQGRLEEAVKIARNEDANVDEDRFFFGLCPVSSTVSGSLKACSGCLAVFYRGREEQLQHWPEHKAFCKLLQRKVKEATPKGHHVLSGKPEAQADVQQYLEAGLNRRLTQFEADVLMYPRTCAVCFDGQQAKLRNCEKCHCVAYCCPEHREEDREFHAGSCSDLRSTLEVQRTLQLIKNCASLAPEQKDRLLGFSRKFFLPSATVAAEGPGKVKDMEGAIGPYLDHCLDSAKLSRHLLPREVEDLGVGGNGLRDFWLRRISFKYTCQMSVAFAIWETGVAEKTFTVHVVGAREAEVKDVTAWEIIPLLIPDIKDLTVVFVGPEINWPYPKKSFRCTSDYLQTAANGLAQVRYVFQPGLYHQLKGGPAAPNIVAALNCGFIFYRSWDRSLPHLVKRPGVPLVFTEYYLEDTELDLEKVDGSVEQDLYVRVPVSRNPFASLLPCRIPAGFNFKAFQRKNVIFSNDHICVLNS